MNQKTPKQNKLICKNCSLCCEHISLNILSPESEEDSDIIRWYLYHNVQIFITDLGLWYADIPIKCAKLNCQGECDIYDSRPHICKEYSQYSCEKFGIGTESVFTFKSVDEFDNFLVAKNINFDND